MQVLLRLDADELRSRELRLALDEALRHISGQPTPLQRRGRGVVLRLDVVEEEAAGEAVERMADALLPLALRRFEIEVMQDGAKA